jgi:hypothetical protein
MESKKAIKDLELNFATEYTKQKVLKFYDARLILFEKYGVFRLDFISKSKIDGDKEYDTDDNWEKVANWSECIFKRGLISAVELDLLAATKKNKQPKDLWRITISVAGLATDVAIKCHDEGEIRKLYSIVLEWWLND